jgi:hypothetical protein
VLFSLSFARDVEDEPKSQLTDFFMRSSISLRRHSGQ